ncbi:MAG: hypothetical protein JEZ10_03360, partial [Verrucomicrobia bacterium]|nr:hypothetical protein [Verrucomicrobiota bacterium]
VPAAGTAGALHIDWMNFVSYMSLKRHSDYQVVNNKPSHGRYDSYTILEYDQGLKQMAPSPIGAKEIASFRTIRQRIEYLVLGEGNVELDALDGKSKKSLQTLFRKGNAAFNKLNIKEENGVVNGQPIFSGRDEHVVPGTLNFQAAGQDILFPLALEYRLTKNPEALEKVMLLNDFLYDQGFAAGSANGTADHMIRVNSFGLSMLLLQDELEQTGRMERAADSLAWFSMLGSAFSTPEDEGVNTDFIRGAALPKLISVLLMDDSPEKAGAMKGLLGYYNHVCKFAPGYSDTIKPDYSLYHHRSAFQSAYGVSMVATMVMIDWLLEGTEYELSAETRTVLRNTLEAQLKMANVYDLHPGVCGRFPDKSALDSLLLHAYAFAAASDLTVDDADMAAMFNRIYSPDLVRLNFPGLAYNGTLGTVELMEKVAAAAGGRKLGPADGHDTFPYAAYSTHRRDNWMAAVRGWSQYVWDFESGSKNENNLGRYLSHGALFLIPEEGLKESSQNINLGYHWGFLPGATTKALPVEKTVFDYVATEKYLECKHRNYTDETFVGGVKLGQNGFFSMKLHDTVSPDEERILFDDSFRATKSYFFVDDKIYCLGTGIENSDERFNTVTTLFQNTADAEAAFENGVIRDVNGNVYVVPDGQNVKVLKSEQDSYRRSRSDLVSCSGPNVRAWIDHGAAPAGAAYEYMVAVNSTEAVPMVPFNVLQKDSTAHIIQNSQVTAFAVFEPARFKGEGVVSSLDTPLLLMTEEQEDTLKLGIADPDLRLKKWGHNMSFMPGDIVHAEGLAHTAKITLAGRWALQTPADGIRVRTGWFRNRTTLSVPLQHGLTKELELKHR